VTGPVAGAAGASGPGAPDTDGSPWQTLGSRVVYENPWIRVREDDVVRPDGSRGVYGVVVAHGAVGVVPLHADGSVVLVRQWRYVAGRPMWEIPTGGVHGGEGLEEAVQRELAEEAGHRAGTLVPLGSILSSKSVMDETCHLFLGTDLAPAAGVPDPTEDIEVGRFPLAEAVRMVLDGEILDAMSVVALLRTERLLAGGPAGS
jgi:8-oxo-dGTP pyrophosphatase MutT (NUDIX family)